MKVVFADTNYWYALALPRDEWGPAARAAKKRLGNCRIVTTDEVLTEFLNGLSGHGRFLRRKAIDTVRTIMRSANVDVLPQTRETFLQALNRYENREDKAYSLVDCASMNILDRDGIREVLTHDHHFEQDGYVVLMKSKGPS